MLLTRGLHIKDCSWSKPNGLNCGWLSLLGSYFEPGSRSAYLPSWATAEVKRRFYLPFYCIGLRGPIFEHCCMIPNGWSTTSEPKTPLWCWIPAAMRMLGSSGPKSVCCTANVGNYYNLGLRSFGSMKGRVPYSSSSLSSMCSSMGSGSDNPPVREGIYIVWQCEQLECYPWCLSILKICFDLGVHFVNGL